LTPFLSRKGVFVWLSKEIMMFKQVLAVMIVISLLFALPTLAQENVDPGAKAIEYVKTLQNEDGGFPNGWAPESDLGTTADVIVAAVAAKQDLKTVFPTDPVNYLETQVEAGNATTTGQIAKVVTAAVAAGQDPTNFGGRDLISDLLKTQTPAGIFGTGAFEHCLAIIALQNAAVDLPEGTVTALVAAQNKDGGWGFMAGEASDTNTSGLCLQALALTDAADSADAGLAYLAAIQNDDTGWPYQNPSDYGTDSDTNSTALVVQALIATGQALDEWGNPQEWLLSMQNESGSFSLQAPTPGDNVLATVAAIPAIEETPLNFWAIGPEGGE
jgi:prenyltransferase beta subunit